jgi:single-strand DNA-binding protein
MSDTLITLTGNAGADPVRKVLASGAVVTTVRVATTPRRFDKAAEEWRDLETMWFTVRCWRSLADNVAASVRKGDRVVATGRLSVSSWTGREGEPRTTHEIDATAVGFELTRASVTAHRPERVGPAGPAEDQWTAPPPVVDPDTGELLEALPEQPAA